MRKLKTFHPPVARPPSTTKHLKEMVLLDVASGDSVKDALEKHGVTYSTYMTWRRRDGDFRVGVKQATRERAHYIHEEFHRHNVKPLAETNIRECPEEHVPSLKRKVDAIAQVQNILSKHKEEDFYHSFGRRTGKETDGEEGGNITINTHIDPEQYKKIREIFTPKVDSKGNIYNPNEKEVEAAVLKDE